MEFIAFNKNGNDDVILDCQRNVILMEKSLPSCVVIRIPCVFHFHT